MLSNTDSLTGCVGKASTTVTADGNYYLTTFGDSTDDGQMSCGQYTNHGSWYYAASRQRFGCGAHLRIQANDRCVIAEADDYGPDVCVENAAGKPIIDVSPLVSKHLFGVSAAGWSERRLVHIDVVSETTPLGPCTPVSGDVTAGADCHSATLDQEVPEGSCVQAASDALWYHCVDGLWYAGATGCGSRYGWCHSATLGTEQPPRTCVQSRFDGHWYQCTDAGWERPVEDGAGPLGTCSALYSL